MALYVMFSSFSLEGAKVLFSMAMFPIRTPLPVVPFSLSECEPLIVITLALFKLGNLIKKVPIPVVEGFTVGIALVISLQQIPYALGVSKGQGERTLEVAANTVSDALDIGLKWQTILVVAITLLIKFNIVRIVESFKIKM